MDICDDNPANGCWGAMAWQFDFLIRRINEKVQHLNVTTYLSLHDILGSRILWWGWGRKNENRSGPFLHEDSGKTDINQITIVVGLH